MTLNRNMVNWVVAAIMSILPLSPAMADSATELAAELNSQWNAAFNRGDAGALAGLYAEDAILSPGNGETINGRDGIQELFQNFFDNGVHDHSIEVIEVYKSGNMLHEVARWQAHGTAEDGSQTTFGGILTNTFERDEEGDWKSRAHVWNVK